MELQSRLWIKEQLQGLQGKVEEFFPVNTVDLGYVFSLLMKGQLIEAVSYLFGGLRDMLFTFWVSQKKLFVWLILVGVFSAIVRYVVDAFGQKQIGELAFFTVFMIVTGVLAQQFKISRELCMEGLENVQSITKLLGPAYLLSMSLVRGPAGAASIRVLLLFVMELIEYIICSLLLPGINAYMLLSLIGCLWGDTRLKGLLSLMEKATDISLKVMVSIVTGAGILEGILSESIDKVGNNVTGKLLSMIPGIGDISEGTLKVILESAGLIKNSMGVMLLLFVLLVGVIPISKVLIHCVVLKLSAALMEMLGDKRIVLLVDRMAKAHLMLVKILLTGAVLFVICIALACTMGG